MSLCNGLTLLQMIDVGKLKKTSAALIIDRWISEIIAEEVDL